MRPQTRVVDWAKIIKRWYAQLIPSHLTIAELFSQLRSGEMDGIPIGYLGCQVKLLLLIFFYFVFIYIFISLYADVYLLLYLYFLLSTMFAMMRALLRAGLFPQWWIGLDGLLGFLLDIPGTVNGIWPV